MRDLLRRYGWPAAKILLTLTILAFIGWQFFKDLSNPELYAQPLALGWLVPAALCYLVGLLLPALYWRRLLLYLGQPAPLLASIRAQYISQLGKYVPGKAMALVIRAVLMREVGTSAGLAGLLAFYEVLVNMAAGALLAVLLFALTDPAALAASRGEALLDMLRLQMPGNQRVDRLTLVVLSAGLCLLIGGLILPAVLNRLVKGIHARLQARFPRIGPPPHLKTAWLGEGLLISAPCWVLLGVALWCALQAVPGAGLDFSPGTLAYITAVMALAYVAGFVVPIPGGLGVREFFLVALLAGELATRHGVPPAIARGQVVLAVLLLRLSWTAAELLVAVPLYFLRPAPTQSAVTEDERPPPAQVVA